MKGDSTLSDESRRLTAVACYVYAGGVMTGVERAGFEVLCHLEGDGGYGVSSARLNFPDRPMYYGPARKNRVGLPPEWPLDDLASRNVDFVMSQPPCAIFSPLGIVTTQGADSWKGDPRLQHWFDSLGVLEKIKPRAWCLESVPQAYVRGRPVIDEMTKRALVLGYSVSHLLLDAKWTGIPQSRKRFFIVAHRPAKLIGYHWNWAPPPTVGEVLATVSEPGPGIEVNPRYVEALKHTKPGTGLCDAWMKLNPDCESNRNARGHVIGRPSFQDQRLDADSQMGAFVGHKFYHPTEDRAIGLNEAKALCGYPADFKLAGPETGLQSLLARAVMPPVGAWLANAVRVTLEGEDAAWAERRVTLIDVRKPGVPEVDLTAEYLDDRGRVRVRARVDGSISWYVPNARSGAPLASIERVRVTSGISPAAPSLARLRSPEAPNAIGYVSSFSEPPLWEDCRDGEATVALLETEPASDDRNVQEWGAPDREARGSGTAGAASSTEILSGQNMCEEGAADGSSHPRLRTPVAPPRFVPEPGEGSGKFIQRLWRTTELSPDELVALVHANWAGRTTTRSDVYYNCKKLVESGEAVRPWPGPTRRKHGSGAGGGPNDRPDRDGGSGPPGDCAVYRSLDEEVSERSAGVTAESARTPNPSSQGAASGFTSGPEPIGASRPATIGCNAAAPALAVPDLSRPATGLAVRSTVVPDRCGIVDRALLYFSKLFRPDEAASPLSSARMAWFLQEEIGFDAIYHAGAYSTHVVPAQIGELWIVNSSWMWNTDEWRRIIMRLVRVSDRIVFCQNDYALILNSYHLGVIRDDANYVVLSTAPETTYMEKHGLRPFLVNWNVLTYAPRPESDAERKAGIYYYGSFRAGRQKVFDRYFRDPPASLTVSASSGADMNRYRKAYPGLIVCPRADDVYAELETWSATLVLEDERANRTYVSPPNRFYEALSSRCPMIFDAQSVPMFRRYGFDVEPFSVSGPRDLADHFETPDWAVYLGELQEEWHRDYFGELRNQLGDARKALERGELGRRGAPPHLKRYVLTEDGGEY